KAGTVTITAKIKDTDYKASCKITVKKDPNASDTYDTPQELIAEMTVGWNLGNTLDASGKGLSSETAWGNPKTTKAMITAVKKAGFNTVRIPVTWDGHVDSSGKIDKEWLDRVQEVVDYAYDSDMFVILNMHHDNNLIPLDEASEKAITKKYKYIWKQIANRFKNYDEKLIFEGRNEPRTEGSAKEWTGGTKSERDVLNRMYEAFVDTVRAAGGFNETRFLMIAPYAATSTSYAAMTALKIPDDGRIIVSVHSYAPYNVALNGDMKYKTFDDSGKREIDSVFENVNKAYLSKGIPVIMGEFGVTDKGNTSDRVKNIKYYLSVAKKYGVPCVWWDNGGVGTGSDKFAILNRKTCEWYYPEIVKAITGSVK
ncbi:MAG: glycoside hydrolase family 5 protein, partial [Muribaculaceae bacterium]|nr:glycoside hydrolase family 5 protein [Muribaculaceae bacterium]